MWRAPLAPFLLYRELNPFLTMNSLPTMNSVTHALKKTSPCYLTQLEAAPYVTHALRVVSSARSFAIVLGTLF